MNVFKVNNKDIKNDFNVILMSLLLELNKSHVNLLNFFRSSRPEVFFKKGILRNFAKFTGKYPCQSLFLIKLQAQISGTDVYLLILRDF